MYHPFMVEMMAKEHSAMLRASVTPRCERTERRARITVREPVAWALVKLGMFVDHVAGERAAAHVH